jgi:hypothetical protein
MTQPTSRDLHIDAPLTNVSVKFNNAEMIGEKIVPVINVKKDSDKYFTYGRQDFRTYQTLRAPGTRAKQVEWTASASNTYTALEYSLEEQLIDEVRDNADDPIKYDADSVEIVTNMLMLDIEKKIADKLADTGNFASYSTPASLWADFVNSDPVKDIDDGKQTVKDAISLYPNTMVVSDKVHKLLRRHPKLLDMYKYTRGGTLTVDILKEIFEVQNYYVGGASYLSSKEGQTEVLANVWANNCALLYIPPSPGIKQITWSYLFRKQGYRMVERWREDALKSDWIRVSDKYDIKIISTLAGYLYQSVI